MRVDTLKTKTVHSSGVHDSLYGTTGGFVGPITYTETLSRSDVVVNPVDSGGWRQPSPYRAYREATSPITSNWSGVLWAWNSRRGYWYKQRTFTFAGGGAFARHWRPPVKVQEYYMNLHLPNSNAVNASIIKARNNVADRTASLSESVLEARTTMRYINGRSSQILRFLKCAAKRDVRGMAAALRLNPRSKRAKKAASAFRRAGHSTASAWLEYWFAIVPIVSDVGVVLGELSRKEPETFRVHGSGIFELAPVSTDTWVKEEYSDREPWVDWMVTHTYERSVYTSLWYEIDSSSLRRLTKFGALDVPQALWAVVPWSFVVDWVLPISEVLRSLTATAGLTFKGGSTTRRVKGRAVGVPTIHDPYSYTSQKYTEIDFDYSAPEVDGVLIDRSVHASDPNPMALWVKDPFDAWKAATSLSLIATRLLKTQK